MHRLLLVLTVTALASGCIEELPLIQVVLDSRPIGARMEVDGEPSRAWPRPDESGTVTFFVVDPTESTPISWGFVVCPATVTPSGLTFCSGEPIDFALQMEPTLDPVEVPVRFPSAALAGVDYVLVTGVICPNGTPVVDLDGDIPEVDCAGDGEARQLVSYTIRVVRGDIPPNNNPTIADDAFTFAGEPWLASTTTPPETGCRDMAGTPELPLASRRNPGEMGTDMAGNEVGQERIGITGDQAEREEYPAGEGTRREDLVFGHLTTAGEPTRPFSVIDDAAETAELKWSYPNAEDDPAIPDDGMLVRWWFTVIDQRGGTGPLARRLICVVP